MKYNKYTGLLNVLTCSPPLVTPKLSKVLKRVNIEVCLGCIWVCCYQTCLVNLYHVISKCYVAMLTFNTLGTETGNTKTFLLACYKN